MLLFRASALRKALDSSSKEMVGRIRRRASRRLRREKCRRAFVNAISLHLLEVLAHDYPRRTAGRGRGLILELRPGIEEGGGRRESGTDHGYSPFVIRTRL